MEGNIKVTTEKIKETEELLLSMADLAISGLQAARKEVEGVRGSFASGAVSLLERTFDSFAKEGQARFKEIMAHIGKLCEIAVIYEEAEKANELVTADNRNTF